MRYTDFRRYALGRILGIDTANLTLDRDIKKSLDFRARLQLLKSPTSLKVKIVERSIQNNRFCFLELARKSGTMTEAELVVLSQWYEFLERNMTLDLDLIVYLRSTPSVAYQRMKKRNRSEESGAPEIYLERLHNAYEEWLVKQRHGKIEVK